MTKLNSNLIKDCIIIGGGPAGLMAAIYLLRFRRNIMLIDNSQSRAALIPLSHNYPGFPQGISGQQLLANMRQQVMQFGGEITSGTVLTIQKDDDDIFVMVSDKFQIGAKRIILATGVVDIEPELPDVAHAIQRGLIRHCPVCDGYEVINQKIGVIGHGKQGMQEALFLRTFSSDITLFTLGQEIILEQQDKEILQGAKIKLMAEPIVEVKTVADKITALISKTGQEYHFDTLYSALGAQIRSDIAIKLGAEHKPNTCLIVDEHQQTSIKGLYAVGDIVSGLNQISVATGQAAIAATAIHNNL